MRPTTPSTPSATTIGTRGRGLVAAVIAAAMVAVPVAADAAPPTQASAPTTAEMPDRPLVTTPAVADPDVGRLDVPEDEYAVTLGCYALTSVATGAPVGRSGEGWAAAGAEATPLYFQPTALGSYLLHGDDESLLAATPGPAEQLDDGLTQLESVAPLSRTTDLPRSVDDDLPAFLVDDPLDLLPLPDTLGPGLEAADTASWGADWALAHLDDGSFQLSLPAASGRLLHAAADGTLTIEDAATTAASPATRFTLARTEGCTPYPELDLDLEGPVLAGRTPWDETRGTIDAHLHLMAYEFLGGRARCGQPWHRWGVEFAMADCPSHTAGGGTVLEFALSSTAPGGSMYPEFSVPTSSSLTYEQVYHRWLERAWRGGLRMMTVLLVDNNVLCEAFPYKENSCNEMDAVRLQAQRVREFEEYVDARSGGPGEGWFRVVTDPLEAREVVNEGKLAIVLGIEVSVLFDCGEFMGVSRCTDQDIVDQLDEVQELGVTQLELVNKFDNALSGVKGDSGSTGVLVGAGNVYETGHFWRMETCPEERTFGTDRTQTNLVDEAAGTPFEEPARDQFAGMVLQATGTSGAVPLYPAGPHCNTAGLTAQGEFLLRELAARGMIFDPDHMSARAAEQALDVMEEIGHHGIVSSHSWADDLIYERVYELGGTVTPYAGGAAGFAGKWAQHRQWMDERYYFGFGYGADANGFGAQGGARNPVEGEGVAYPFEVAGGAVVDRLTSGERAAYDINTDGVAHYGLYPDWLEDLRAIAGDAIVDDMLRGPEAYLQVWERARGIAKDACVFAPGTDPTADVEVGTTVAELLATAGQPHLRDDRGWTYCGTDRRGRATDVLVELGGDGVVTGIEARRVGRNGPPSVNTTVADEQLAEVAATAAAQAQPVDRTHDHDHGQGAEHAADAAQASHVHADGSEHLHADGALAATGTGVATSAGGASSQLPVTVALGLLLAASGLLLRAQRRRG